MRQMPDNHYTLAIVDPPYFAAFARVIIRVMQYQQRALNVTTNHLITDVPTRLFDQLVRYHKTRCYGVAIIYAKYISAVGRIVWDKRTTATFSKCRLQAIHLVYVLINLDLHGMVCFKKIWKQRTDPPMPKPIALYAWILHHYAKPAMLHTGYPFGIGIYCMRLLRCWVWSRCVGIDPNTTPMPLHVFNNTPHIVYSEISCQTLIYIWVIHSRQCAKCPITNNIVDPPYGFGIKPISLISGKTNNIEIGYRPAGWILWQLRRK